MEAMPCHPDDLGPRMIHHIHQHNKFAFTPNPALRDVCPRAARTPLQAANHQPLMLPPASPQRGLAQRRRPAALLCIPQQASGQEVPRGMRGGIDFGGSGEGGAGRAGDAIIPAAGLWEIDESNDEVRRNEAVCWVANLVPWELCS